MHTCLWPGAQILFRHKWRKLATASPLLHCNDTYSCLGSWNEFFSGFQVLSWSFLERNVTETFAIGVRNWFDHEWVIFGDFCWIMPRYVNFMSAWTKNSMNCSFFIPFWRHQIFSIVREIFWSVLWTCLYFSAVVFCKIGW